MDEKSERTSGGIADKVAGRVKEAAPASEEERAREVHAAGAREAVRLEQARQAEERAAAIDEAHRLESAADRTKARRKD